MKIRTPGRPNPAPRWDDEPVHDWAFEVHALDRLQTAAYWKRKLEASTWQCDACGHRARVRDERECQECGRPWTNDPVLFGRFRRSIRH